MDSSPGFDPMILGFGEANPALLSLPHLAFPGLRPCLRMLIGCLRLTGLGIWPWLPEFEFPENSQDDFQIALQSRFYTWDDASLFSLVYELLCGDWRSGDPHEAGDLLGIDPKTSPEILAQLARITFGHSSNGQYDQAHMLADLADIVDPLRWFITPINSYMTPFLLLVTANDNECLTELVARELGLLGAPVRQFPLIGNKRVWTVSEDDELWVRTHWNLL